MFQSNYLLSPSLLWCWLRSSSSLSQSCIHNSCLRTAPNCSVFLCLQSWVPSVHPVHGLQGPFKSVLLEASHTCASNPPVAFSYNKNQTPTPYCGLEGDPWYPATAASFFPQVCQAEFHFLASAVTSAFCLGCSSLRYLCGCLLLVIQISTQFSLLSDGFCPILAIEVLPSCYHMILFSL